jgi:hypothetical protein
VKELMNASAARSRLPSRVSFRLGGRSLRQNSDSPAQLEDEPAEAKLPAVGGPVSVAWREGTLTRAEELEALCAWARTRGAEKNNEVLATAIKHHLNAARQAATAKKLHPHRRFRIFRNGPLIERARSNIDAAETHLLNLVEPNTSWARCPACSGMCDLICLQPTRGARSSRRSPQNLGSRIQAIRS